MGLEIHMPKSFYIRLKERFPGLVSVARKYLRGETGRVRTSIQGQKNDFFADGAKLSGVIVDIIGDNNRIKIGAGSVLSNVTFRLRGSGHQI